eukprot:m.16511 g.16511  ORF g.16511 m.16511 type:complete len:210 (+) comp26975_c0_seq2:130-759(+)
MAELKTFESQNEAEERRKQRQEEWEKVRGDDQPEKCPDEEVVWDGKTLYQRLREQKEEKQLEWEEQFKFKNMVYKGLDEDEATFLNRLSEKQALKEMEKRKEEKQYLEAFREALEKEKAEEVSGLLKLPSESKITAPSTESEQLKKKSQQALLTGIIVRKRKSTEKLPAESTEKIPKSDETEVSVKSSSGKLGLVSYGSESGAGNVRMR